MPTRAPPNEPSIGPPNGPPDDHPSDLASNPKADAPLDSSDAEPPLRPPPPPPRRRGSGRLALTVLGVAVVGGALSLPFTATGTRTLLTALQPVTGLVVEAPQGALLAGDFSAQRLRLPLAGGRVLTVEQPAWTGLRWHGSSRGLAGLTVERLSATQIDLAGAAADSGPLRLPSTLRLPIDVTVNAVQVGELRTEALREHPLRDLRGRLTLQAGRGATHRLDAAQLDWDRLHLDASAQLAGDAPLTLQARSTLRPRAETVSPPGPGPGPGPATATATPPIAIPADWLLTLQADGPLADLALQAQLAASGQSLQAQAQLQAEAAVPLARLQAQFEALDLAPLASVLPRTALTGRVDIRLDPAPAGRAAEPLSAQATLRNDAPGAWQAGRLPLQSLELLAHGDPRALDQGRVDTLKLVLGTPREPAGSVVATGQWALIGQGAARRVDLTLEAAVDTLRPQRLHPASPPLQIGGPLAWHLNLPWPTGPATGAESAAAPAGFVAELRTRLTGQLLGSGLPAATLAIEARAEPGRLQIAELQAEAGGARLKGQGELLRRAGAVTLQWHSQLQDFDPALWWVRAASPSDPPALVALDRLFAARPHRLNGRLDADLNWPAGVPANLDGLAQLRGHAELDLQPSRWAGLAVAGQWRLQSSPSPLSKQPRVSTRLALQVGPADTLTTVQVDGELDPVGRRDHWQLAASSADLATLAPWLRVVPGLPTLAGRGEADLELDGRWPVMQARGRLEVPALRVGAGTAPLATASPAVSTPPAAGPSGAAARLDLTDLRARWRIGTADSDPLEIDARVDRLNAGGWQGRGLALTASGSGAAHQLHVDVADASPPRMRSAATPAAPATPPANGAPNGTASGSAANGRFDWPPLAATLNASGSWEQNLAQGQFGWHGQIQELVLREVGAAARAAVAAAAAASADTSANTSANTAANTAANTPAITPSNPAGPTAANGVGATPGRGGNGSAPSPGTAPTATATATAAAEPAAPLGLSRPLRLQVDPTTIHLNHAPDLTTLTLGETRAHLGALSLALQHFAWQRDHRGAAPDDRLALRAQLESIEVAPILRSLQPGFGWGGDLRIGGHVELQATSERFALDAALQRERGDLQVTDPDNPRNPQRLGLAELGLTLAARDGHWRLGQRISGGNLGRLVGEQRVEAHPAALWPGAAAPVTGQIDLQVAQLGNWGRWLPAGWRLSGQLDTQARITGTVGAPELSGELSGRKLAVRNLLQGVDWHDADIKVQLDGSTARVETASVRAGEGRLSATGALQLGAAPRLDLDVKAERFAVLQRVDRRIVASGEATLALDGRSTVLKGKLRADEGRIDISQADAPSLADDVTVQRPEDIAARERAAAAARNPRTTVIDVRADLGDNFTLRGRGLTTRLAGEVRITSPASKLAVNGAIRTEEGSYAAYGQKLVVDRGVITFTGAPENPRLDIEATRGDLEDVRVGVAITGPAQSLRVRLFSVPSMSDTDKLSWLLLGRASDGLGRTDLALLQRAAYALISGENEAPSIVERIGLDQLSVRQNETGDTRETVVSLGKQLSRRWYVGYERSLNAAAGSWQLIYRAAQRFTLRAQTGSENALDLIWTWKWPDEPPAAPATAPAEPGRPLQSAPSRSP